MPLLECENHHLFNGSKYGTTCPYCGLKVSASEAQAEKEQPAKRPQEYVCGWLVCIKGVNKGQAYELHDGKNFLGSGEKMDIRVLGDKRIEKQNHAVLVYGEKERTMTLMPGDSSGMVYCDQNAMYEPKQLTEYQKIELGDSTFLFVPFCRAERFGWDDSKDERREGAT